MLKLTTLSCLIFLLVNKAFSQNYQPINSGRVSNLKAFNDKMYVYNTLIDSVFVSGLDSVFYSYEQLTYGAYHPDPTDSFNQVGKRTTWWGRKALLKPNGSIVFLTSQLDSLEILTMADLNNSWVLFRNGPDSIFYATVTDIQTSTILGVSENIKEISIELRNASNQVLAHPFNGKKIRLGENIGFIQAYRFASFPTDTTSYNLIGVDGLGGFQTLSNKDIYNFQIGDKFTYHYSGSDEFANYSYDYSYRILNKINNINDVTYSVNRTGNQINFDYSLSPINDTIQLTYNYAPVYLNNYWDNSRLLLCKIYFNIYGEVIVNFTCPDTICEGNESHFFENLMKARGQISYTSHTSYSDVSLGESLKLTHFNDSLFSIGVSSLSAENIDLNYTCDGNISCSYPFMDGVQYLWEFSDGSTYHTQTVNHLQSSNVTDTLVLTLIAPGMTFRFAKQINWRTSAVLNPDFGIQLGNACNEILLTAKNGPYDSVYWHFPDGTYQVKDTVLYSLNSLDSQEIRLTVYSQFCYRSISKSFNLISLDTFPVPAACGQNPDGISTFGSLKEFQYKNASFIPQDAPLFSQGCLEQSVYVTETISVRICAGKTSLISGLNTWVGAAYQIWIDYNNDGNFVLNEKVAFGTTANGSYASDYRYSTHQISIPDNAILNTKLRMRVCIGGITDNPCSGASYDLSIRILMSNFIYPVAQNDSVTGLEENNILIDFLSNDSDTDGNLNPASVDLDPSTDSLETQLTTNEGRWTMQSDFKLLFEPKNNFSGSATISYTVHDNEALVSNPASVVVFIQDINDAPIAKNDLADGAKNSTLSIPVLDNDFDYEGKLDSLSIDLDPTIAGIQVSYASMGGDWNVSSSKKVTFSPKINYLGVYSLDYSVKDLEGLISNVAKITVNVLEIPNTPPQANPDSAQTLEDTPVSFSISANDTDAQSIANPFFIDLNPSTTTYDDKSVETVAGSWIVDFSGKLSFTPKPNFNGWAQIIYRIKDNQYYSESTNISIWVEPQPDAPIPLDDSATFLLNTFATLDIAQNDSDPDGNLTADSGHLFDLDLSTTDFDYVFTNADAHWQFDPLTGLLTCAPNADFQGKTSISYRLCDADGLCDEAQVNITFTDEISAINELLRNENMLFPNPASSVLHIKAENLRQIRVYSAIGQLIYEGASENNIDVSAWSTGLYIFEARFENAGTIREEFIKE